MSLYNQTRPKRFDQVIGSSQKTTCEVLKTSIENVEVPKGIFLHGSSGTGKTTIARIYAALLNCSDLIGYKEPCGACTTCKYIFEQDGCEVVDGSVDTGIDAMREIIRTLSMRSLVGLPKRVVIFDEMHNLSKQAQDSLLTTVENPPKHTVMIFCTTEPQKVLKTLRTRCLEFALTPPTRKEIIDLLCRLSEGKLTRDKLEAGIPWTESVREAVNSLEVLLAGGKPTELENKEEADPARKLASIIAAGDGKKRVTEVAELLRALRSTPTARAIAVEYLHSCILKAIGQTGAGLNIRRWGKAIRILTRHPDNALPALFTVDALEALSDDPDPPTTAR